MWNISLICLLICLLANISNAKSFYTINTKQLKNPSILNALNLEQELTKYGFELLTHRNLTNSGFKFDFVYTTPNWSQAIILKEGLMANDTKFLADYHSNDMNWSVGHIQINQSDYIVMGFGIKSSELESMIRPFSKRTKYSIIDWFLPKAQAANGPACKYLISNNDQLKNSADFVILKNILSSVGKCATDAFVGAQKNIDETADFFSKLANNPEFLWNEMKDSFLNLRNFVLNIGTEMMSMYSDLKNISANEIATIACTMTGQMILSTISSGGLALAGAGIPFLIQKMKNAIDLIKKVSLLKNKGLNIPSLGFVSQEAMSCAL